MNLFFYLLPSNVRLGFCTQVISSIFSVRFSTIYLVGISHFILNLNTEFSHSFDVNFFVIIFMTIDCQQQICNEAAENLNHKSVLTSSYEMIDFQMAFPPSEEIFNFPTKFVCLSNIFCREVITICRDPVFYIGDFITDKS